MNKDKMKLILDSLMRVETRGESSLIISDVIRMIVSELSKEENVEKTE